MLFFRYFLFATVIGASPLSAQQWTRVSVNRTAEVVGNGQVVTQQRAIGEFRELNLEGVGDLVVRIGPQRSLTVTADSNILPVLGQRLKNGRLVLEARQSFRTQNRPRYVVTVPSLDALGVGGSGTARIDGIGGNAFSIAIGGSGTIIARGRTGRLSIAIGGSGNVDASALRAASVGVTIGGSGAARVATNGPLSGTIAGSGSVRYLGRPSSVAVTRIGSGTVAPLW